MKKFIVIVIILCAFPVFAADKNKQKKETITDWYIYKIVFENGHRIPVSSQCEKSATSLADSIESLGKNRVDYKIVEQVTQKDKPIVVDIQTFRTFNNNGYRMKYINVTRFVRGEQFCNKFREDDLSGKLDESKLDRYR